MLNEYFAIALPAILEFGGVPVQLAGDAVMAVFGAPKPQPDHAARACSAALAILERTEPLATGPQAGPRFHIGVNSGPALVGNIGSEEYRNFTAIGDTTNLAARLQDVAQPGDVVIGPTTAADLDGRFELSSLGPVHRQGPGRADRGVRTALRLIDHSHPLAQRRIGAAHGSRRVSVVRQGDRTVVHEVPGHGQGRLRRRLLEARRAIDDRAGTTRIERSLDLVVRAEDARCP